LRLSDRFVPFEVVPFSWDEMREFLVRREGSPGDLDATGTRADAWLERVSGQPRLLELVRQPLLLMLARAVETADHRLPVERVHLYARAIEAMVDDSYSDRVRDKLRRATGDRVDAGIVLRALGVVALELHAQRRLAQPVSRPELHRMLADELGSPGLADGALEVFAGPVGLLVGADGGLRFWHASFAEYLAATALAETSRQRPRRLLRTASSSEGREVVRMAFGWARAFSGDTGLAPRLFDELLADCAGGPWSRLFGVHVHLAVDVVRDGHPLAGDGFTRVLARVLDLVERAPLMHNAELLVGLVAARPTHACPPQLAAQIISLIRRPACLQGHVKAALMRWIARLTPGSPEALACCEEVLAASTFRDDRHAALGLLRAGVVRPDLCLALTAKLALSSEPEGALEAELADELLPLRAQLLPALRTLWQDIPPPPDPRRIQPDRDTTLHRSLMTLLALLDDTGEDLLAALFADVIATRTGRDVVSRPLRWLMCHGPARRRIGDALLDADTDTRHAAVEVLRAMLQRPDQADTAADTAFAALQRAPERLPTAVERLVQIRRAPPSRDKRTVLDALLWLTQPHQGRVPASFLRRWSQLPTDTGGLRWSLAGLLWSACMHARGTDLTALAECLLAATTDVDPEIAVTSASLLHEAWDRLDEPGQQTVMRAWIRGLHHPGACTRDEPIGPVCRAAWDGLRWRSAALDADGQEILRAVRAGPHPVAATIATLLRLPNRDAAPRRRAPLLESLGSDDLQRAFVAYDGLSRENAGYGPELLERWFEAAIRVALAGWTHGIVGAQPPTRAMLEVFLRTPCTGDADAIHSNLRATEVWLATHPDAFTLALASITTDVVPGARSAELLAACLTTPERVTALVARITVGGAAPIGRAVSAIRRACIYSGTDSPLRPAFESALRALLAERLRSDDLATVRRAVAILDDFFIFADDLPAARARLLDVADAAGRRAAITRWLSFVCPPAQREVSAHQFFDRGLAELADTLRPGLTDADPMATLEAGLLLRRLTGETDPLRAACHALLAAPAAESTDRDEHHRLAFLLDTEPTRELLHAISFARWSSSRTWAMLALDDLGESFTPAAIHALFGEPDPHWDMPAWIDWILEHRPAWRAHLEPTIVGCIKHTQLFHLRKLARRLHGHDALTPAILAALVDRWPEWLTSRWPDKDSHLSTFVGIEAVPDAPARTAWRDQLHASDPELRERAALALGMCEAVDDELADALIDVYFAWRMPAAKLALACLLQPESVAVFEARRRARVTSWRTPEDAAELLMLWPTPEACAQDRSVTLPLLAAAARRDDICAAVSEAIWFAAIDEPAGLAAITLLAASSTRAAAWLVERRHSSPATEARLWHALARPEDGSDWELAAELLLPAAHGDPRVPQLLADAVVRGDRISSTRAIWLLTEHSRERALVAILEHLAQDASRSRDAADWLLKLARGGQPGQPCTPPPDPPPEPGELREDPDSLFVLLGTTLRYAETLDGVARTLLALEQRLALDLTSATAMLLGGDGARWTGLWGRALAGKTTPEEFAGLRDIVDVRPHDRPGQRLARLYWRLKLPEPALLERDAPASHFTALVLHGAPDAALLDALLDHAFDDDAGLRRFIAGMGYHDQMLGRTASLEELRNDISEKLARRGVISDVMTGLDRHGLLAPDDRDTWQRLGRH
jgi:hypothetical protein